MVGSISNGQDLSGAASLYFSQQLQNIGGQSPLSSLTGSDGSAGAVQSSAAISGPGQLLSNLQQLQTQDPAKFQQVITQIAGQLQTAAQQAQGPQSNFLSNLAAKFQGVADGGSLSQLQPQQAQQPSQHHHHHHHAQQAYNQGGQNQSQGLAGLGQSSSGQAPGNASIQQLFSSISSEVSNALGG